MHRLVFLVSLIAAASCAFPRKVYVPMLDGRIVGGEPVKIENYNYQASLLYSGKHICGAAIISANTVLTAAHCTKNFDAFKLQIRAGSSVINHEGVVINISEVHEHPSFNDGTMDYDISIVRLASNLSFSAAIGVIALPELNAPEPVGAVSVVSGWGSLIEGGGPASQLQAVQLPVISLAECRNAYDPESITERMICAGVKEGGRDACQGDSGGPLVVDGILYGIVSWGRGCARPRFVGVYTNVASVRDFITDTVGF